MKAATAAEIKRAEIASSLTKGGLVPSDTSIVVFGSLARAEWTGGSDLDWTLLVDGPVVANHAEVAARIKASMAASGNSPGPTGTFGGLTFSHDLVHLIGGEDDTNINITRRLLLLLESTSLAGAEVRERVLRALLARYIGEDLGFHAPDRFMVPRFLLNDYVRYWRTMAVDSAQKRRDRVDKWALRNIKLRLSRKLLFAAGLWACLSCRLRPSAELESSRDRRDRAGVAADMMKLLLNHAERPPLETLAQAFVSFQAWDAAVTAFDAYERFLVLLDDPAHREHLALLKVEDAATDAIFNEAKSAASGFQDGLMKFFFNTNDNLTADAQKYGVF